MALMFVELLVLLLSVLVGMAEAQQCYSGGTVAGIAIGVAIATLALVGIIIGILLYLKSRRNRQKLALTPKDEKGVENGHDNPAFADDADGRRQAAHSHAEKGFGGYVQCIEYEGKGKNHELHTPDRINGEARGKFWSPDFSVLSSTYFGSNLNSKSGSRSSLDDGFPTDGEGYGVTLESQDIIGLGFNICGSMRDGIFIREVLNRGPASESGLIKAGDRIRGLWISFENMVFEDALTILSYASPYPVHLRMQKCTKSLSEKSSTEIQATTEVGELHHPFLRSQSMDDVSKIGKEGMLNMRRARSEMKRGSNKSHDQERVGSGRLRKWTGQDAIDLNLQKDLEVGVERKPHGVPRMDLDSSDLRMDADIHREDIIIDSDIKLTRADLDRSMPKKEFRIEVDHDNPSFQRDLKLQGEAPNSGINFGEGYDNDIKLEKSDFDLQSSMRDFSAGLGFGKSDIDASVEVDRPDLSHDLKVNPDIDTKLRSGYGFDHDFDTDVKFGGKEADMKLAGKDIDVDFEGKGRGLQFGGPNFDGMTGGKKVGINYDGPDMKYSGDADLRMGRPGMDVNFGGQNADMELSGPDFDANLGGKNIDANYRIGKPDIESDLRIRKPEVDTNFEIGKQDFDSDLRIGKPGFDSDLRIGKPDIDTEYKIGKSGIGADIDFDKDGFDNSVRIDGPEVVVDKNLGIDLSHGRDLKWNKDKQLNEPRVRFSHDHDDAEINMPSGDFEFSHDGKIEKEHFGGLRAGLGLDHNDNKRPVATASDDDEDISAIANEIRLDVLRAEMKELSDDESNGMDVNFDVDKPHVEVSGGGSRKTHKLSLKERLFGRRDSNSSESDTDVKSPELDVNVDVDVDKPRVEVAHGDGVSGSGSHKAPKLSLKQRLFGRRDSNSSESDTEVKSPDLDVDVNVDEPHVEVSHGDGGSHKATKLSFTQRLFGRRGSNSSESDADEKRPELDVNVDVDKPHIDIAHGDGVSDGDSHKAPKLSIKDRLFGRRGSASSESDAEDKDENTEKQHQLNLTPGFDFGANLDVGREEEVSTAKHEHSFSVPQARAALSGDAQLEGSVPDVQKDIDVDLDVGRRRRRRHSSDDDGDVRNPDDIHLRLDQPSLDITSRPKVDESMVVNVSQESFSQRKVDISDDDSPNVDVEEESVRDVLRDYLSDQPSLLQRLGLSGEGDSKTVEVTKHEDVDYAGHHRVTTTTTTTTRRYEGGGDIDITVLNGKALTDAKREIRRRHSTSSEDEKGHSSPSWSSRSNSPDHEKEAGQIRLEQHVEVKHTKSNSPDIKRRSAGGLAYDITATDLADMSVDVEERKRGEHTGGIAYYVDIQDRLSSDPVKMNVDLPSPDHKITQPALIPAEGIDDFKEHLRWEHDESSPPRRRPIHPESNHIDDLTWEEDDNTAIVTTKTTTNFYEVSSKGHGDSDAGGVTIGDIKSGSYSLKLNSLNGGDGDSDSDMIEVRQPSGIRLHSGESSGSYKMTVDSHSLDDSEA